MEAYPICFCCRPSGGERYTQTLSQNLHSTKEGRFPKHIFSALDSWVPPTLKDSKAFAKENINLSNSKQGGCRVQVSKKFRSISHSSVLSAEDKLGSPIKMACNQGWIPESLWFVCFVVAVVWFWVWLLLFDV